MPRLGFLLMIVLLVRPAPTLAQQDYFIQADVTGVSPYVGQQVVYSFRLYSRVSRTNPGSMVTPSFDGFWKQAVEPDRKYTALIGDQNYEVKERRFALYPSYAADITIEPATFVIPDQPDRPGEVLTTDPITVHVRPLPTADDLTGFDGAVGEFAIEPTLDRQSSTVGVPVTLRLIVRGTGNLEQLPAPELPPMPAWRAFPNLITYHAQETDDALSGEKTFEWLLTPLTAGAQVLPELTFTYFDPQSETYRSLTTTALTVDILPAEEISSAAPATAVPDDNALSLKPIPAALALGDSQQGWWFWLLWSIPPAALAALWMSLRRQNYRKRNAAYYRQSEALKRARRMLSAAHKAHTQGGFRIIREGITTYFADKLDAPLGSIHYPDIEAALVEARIEPALRSEVLLCLEMADQGLYAPFSEDNADVLARQTAASLAAVDTRWDAL